MVIPKIVVDGSAITFDNSEVWNMTDLEIKELECVFNTMIFNTLDVGVPFINIDANDKYILAKHKGVIIGGVHYSKGSIGIVDVSIYDRYQHSPVLSTMIRIAFSEIDNESSSIPLREMDCNL